jgi:hypothetical protein
MFLVTEIADPARWSAGFHHDEIDVFQARHVLDMVAPSSDGLKSLLMISSIVEAADGVELAEVH